MSQSSSQSPDSWIGTFCSLVGHEYFAEVSEDFIEDDFNLTGLQSQVPMYKDALETILDVEPSETNSSAASEEEEEEEEEEDDGLLGDELDEQNGNPNPNGARGQSTSNSRRHGRTASDASVIESSAELLYGLIHARYITSRPGIQQMMEKYELSHFGYCPRVYCGGARVLPVGLTDIPGQQTVKLFCPSCQDVYTPPNSRFQAVDGAFFGTTFGCLFFMTFPELDIAPLKKARAGREQSTQNQEDAESVFGPTEAGAPGRPNVTASRSSSLTLPSAPPVPGATAPKDDRQVAAASSSSNPAQGTLPLQPTTINGTLTQNLAPGLGRGKIYEPKIYGFRVSERARGGPRMKWLRSKPHDINELDEAALWHRRHGGNVDGDADDDNAGTEQDTINSRDQDDNDTADADGDGDGDGDVPMASQTAGQGVGTGTGAGVAGPSTGKNSGRRRTSNAAGGSSRKHRGGADIQAG